MIYTYGHHANGAKMKFAADVALYRRYSVGADPRKWTSEEVVCDATCLPDHAHNPGLSGDASGQVSAGTELVIFGAPYDLSRSYRLLPDQAAPLPADESTVVTAGCYSGKELPGVYPAGYAPYCWGYWDLYSVQIGDALPFRDISTTPADGIARLDWDYGRGKAMCRAGERIVGLSANVRDGQAERALCRNGGDPYTGIRTVPLTVDARADQRHAARIPDWDFGYYKLECGQSEYVAGVSQNASFVQGSNRFHAILCAAGKRLPAGTGGCRTRLLLARDDRATTATGDWHFGAYKAECGSAEYLAGVSVSPSTGAPHALLCCGKPTPGAQDRPQLPPKPPLSLLPPRG
jgi:hypothetical protein